MRPRFVWSVLVSVLGFSLLGWVAGTHFFRQSDQVCEMDVLDIGQGDAILFQTPDHHQVLFDGGPGASVIDALARRMPPGDHDIDLVVLTHTDSDHLAGLVSVLKHYQVASVLTTGVQGNSATFRAWEDELRQVQPAIIYAQRGVNTSVGKDFIFHELWPEKNLEGAAWTPAGKNGVGGANDTGVAGRVTCGRSTAMMAADISSAVEMQLVQHPEEIQAAVLKVGHHGSHFSSTTDFLMAVHPSLAVISVGQNNSYGHPSLSTLDRFERLKIPYRRTDQEGDIRLKSDGRGSWH